MKKIMILMVCMIANNISFGQDKMIIDKSFSGTTIYDGYSEDIDAITDLPPAVQFNLNGYLKRILGTMADSTTFSRGQIVDLERMFKDDSVTFGNRWIVPKYDMYFVVKNHSIGMLNYYLQIRLDEYGQILKSNWPKERNLDKTSFENRDDIKRFALKQAETMGYDTVNYKIDFKFNEKFDKLCWVFKFPEKIEKNKHEYNIIEVPWDSIEIIDKYKITTLIVR